MFKFPVRPGPFEMSIWEGGAELQLPQSRGAFSHWEREVGEGEKKSINLMSESPGTSCVAVGDSLKEARK